VIVVYGGLGRAGVVLVSGWASSPVKGIIAPDLSSKQTRLRELVAGRERCAAVGFVRAGHRMTHKRGNFILRFPTSCGRVREVVRQRSSSHMTVLPKDGVFPKDGSPAW
jgi:hypothetical protein